MSFSASLIAFVAASSLVIVAPGLDTALVLRTMSSAGARRAAFTSLGIAVGCLSWATLVALGLGALLAASELAYAVLRVIGAAYLVWIGYKMLRHPRREMAPAAGSTVAISEHRAFATGLLTNLLNPKVGVFCVSFLPQFVPDGVAVGPYILLLGAIYGLLGVIWFLCLIAAMRPLSRWLSRPSVVRMCDRLTGGMFVAFGLSLALQARRA